MASWKLKPKNISRVYMDGLKVGSIISSKTDGKHLY